jgi:hypothetical protein
MIPGKLIALTGLHLWLVLRLGVNEWPMPGRLLDRETCRARNEAEVHRTVVYPAYASVTVGRRSALDDQALASVTMWVPGSLVFLVAVNMARDGGAQRSARRSRRGGVNCRWS